MRSGRISIHAVQVWSVIVCTLSATNSASAQAPNVTNLQKAPIGASISPLDQYVSGMRKRIKMVWAPPKDSEDKTVVVVFRISKEGILSRLRLVTSSGIALADKAALNAVEKAAPFPPLPPGSDENSDFQMKFGAELWNEKSN